MFSRMTYVQREFICAFTEKGGFCYNGLKRHVFKNWNKQRGGFYLFDSTWDISRQTKNIIDTQVGTSVGSLLVWISIQVFLMFSIWTTCRCANCVNKKTLFLCAERFSFCICTQASARLKFHDFSNASGLTDPKRTHSSSTRHITQRHPVQLLVISQNAIR